MSGSFTSVGGVLGVGRLGGTEMGCPGAGERQDKWLVSFFTSGPRFEAQETEFTLTAFGDTLRFLPPGAVVGEPDVDLAGTRWRLTGIEETDGDSVGMLGVPRRLGARLEIDGDQIHVDTGCNSAGGHVEVQGDRLELRDVVITQKGCPGIRQDIEGAQVPVVMASSVTWSIEGQQLRLTRGDTTLLFRTPR